jgi:hypothetical protein
MSSTEVHELERDSAPAPAPVPSRAYVLALVLVLVPFLVSAIAVLLDGSGALIQDHALMEMQVRDVGSHPVVMGLYSRNGWSHPGPLIFYSLAVPYRLLGSGTAGLLVGALAINAISIGGMAAIAKRLGGTAAALLTLIGISVLARALGTDVLRDPWVCFVTVIPFGLFCMLAWAMAEREAWALPAAAGVASWLIQTHVGFAPLTTPAVLAGAVWLGFSAIRSRRPGAVRRVLWAGALAVLVVVVLWIPPIWGELFGYGNLSRIVDWFSSARGGVHTMTDGARVVFGQFAAAPEWVTGQRHINPYNGETTLISKTVWPVLLVPFVAAVVVAWRRRDRRVLRLAAVVGFMLIVSVLSVARTIGVMYQYRLLWTWVLATLAAIVVLWTIWNVVAERWPDAEQRVLTPIALLTIGALCVVQTGAVLQAGTSAIYSPATERVTRQVARQLDPHGGEVVLSAPTAIGGWFLQGLLVGLEKDGFAARVSEDPYEIFGHDRVASGDPPQARLVVMTVDDLAANPPGGDLQLIAYSGPQPLGQMVDRVRAAQAEQSRLIAALEDGTIGPDEFNRAMAASKPSGEAFAVYREL